MLTRWTAVGLLAAALFVAGAIPHATAKPPELPRNIKVTCQETATGSILFGVGVSSDAGITGSILLDNTSPAGPMNSLFQQYLTNLVQWFTGYSGVVSVELSIQVPVAPPALEPVPMHPAEGEPQIERLDPPPQAGKGSEFQCPFLRQKAAENQVPVQGATTAAETTVLDNITKLEKAHKLYLQAEHYRRTGVLDLAACCYAEIQALCPGSRYDEKATARLQLVLAQMEVEATDAEEEESVPTPEKLPLHRPLFEVLPMPCPEKLEELPMPQEERVACPHTTCVLRLQGLLLNAEIKRMPNGQQALMLGLGVAGEFTEAVWEVVKDPVWQWFQGLAQDGGNADSLGGY
jgi:hypothetical protein